MNFKVGDMIVFQPQGNNIEDYFLNGVQEGDTGTVTYVDEEDVIADMTTQWGEIVECFYLKPEDCIVQEEKLPPVEATLHIGLNDVKLLLDRSVHEDVYIRIGNTYKEGFLFAGEGIHFTVDEALALAHDIKRMALAVQRGEL
ncbi:hypothetical protein MVUOKPPV_CDS0035 [Klebsiella phage phi1_175008]|uniref:Uncharacterized protein n=2 Tax=Klebsiella phage phi1_175008 TaxID=3127744 RepID=A0ACD5FRK2_9CAUD